MQIEQYGLIQTANVRDLFIWLFFALEVYGER
jgi:hypothetical protein